MVVKINTLSNRMYQALRAILKLILKVSSTSSKASTKMPIWQLSSAGLKSLWILFLARNVTALACAKRRFTLKQLIKIQLNYLPQILQIYWRGSNLYLSISLPNSAKLQKKLSKRSPPDSNSSQMQGLLIQLLTEVLNRCLEEKLSVSDWQHRQVHNSLEYSIYLMNLASVCISEITKDLSTR